VRELVASVLFERKHKYVQDILASIKREASLQREYLRLIEAEKTALQKLMTPTIEDCSTQRQGLIVKIRAEQDLRIGILREILKQITFDRPELKLTAIAERVFHPADSAEIKQQCGILKTLIEIGQKRTKELEGIVSFSMKLVSGSISTILAHSQKPSQIYNASGVIPKHDGLSSPNHVMSRTA